MGLLQRIVAGALIVGGYAGGAVAQEKPVAFVGGRVIPISGPEIENGVVVVHRGKVVGVGAADGVAIPADAERIDIKGGVVMPGLVDTHSHIGGIAGADGSAPIQPEVRVRDSINVFDPGFRRALAGGLTMLNVMPGSGHVLSGQTIYLKLRRGAGDATRIDEFFMYPPGKGPGESAPMGGIKLANGTNPIGKPPFPGTRAKSAALMRERFIKAQEYRQKVEAAKRDNTPEKAPPRDLGLEALCEALDGTRIVHHHTHRADDIITVLRMQEEFGFRVVLQHVSEAWKVADDIAKAQRDSNGKVLGCSVIVIDAPGGKLEAAELSWETGGVLEAAGVSTCFHTDDWITDSRVFLRSGAMAVRAGMSRGAALAAMTIEGAKMLDLGDRVGSLEVGKDADVIVLSGDPFSVYTKVRQTWVEGRKVFDRDDPADRLWAVGGFGAGDPQRPYMCCVDGAGVGGGWMWRSHSGANAGGGE